MVLPRAADPLRVAVSTTLEIATHRCPAQFARVLALACYGCKLLPAEALCAVTHNAACSLGLAHELGRLQVGLSADVLVLATPDYRDLVYHAGSPREAQR